MKKAFVLFSLLLAGRLVWAQCTPITFVADSTPEIICSDGVRNHNGGASVTLLTGPDFPSYAWSNAITDFPYIQDLDAATYSVTIGDAVNTNCPKVTVSITVPSFKLDPILIQSVNSVAEIVCSDGKGNKNGQASISASGGYGFYSYHWNNGDSTDAFTDSLSAGIYCVTVGDFYYPECPAATTCITVHPTQLTPITIPGSDSIPETICSNGHGNQDGQAYLTGANGGSGFYTYNWSNHVSGNQVITNLEAGTYCVMVGDALYPICPAVNVCISVGAHQLNPIQITQINHPEFCSSQNGSACVFPTGGSGYFNYKWSNNATISCINAVKAGVYIVTISDASNPGCPSLVINDTILPDPLARISASGNTTFCKGGSVVLNAVQGNYTYQWMYNNHPISNAILSSYGIIDSSGAYSVVTNNGTCSATSNIINVTINPNPDGSINPNHDTTFCKGGTVTLKAAPGLNYHWSNSESTQNITVSQSGHFAVTVTNNFTCTATSSLVEVTVNDTPVIHLGPPVIQCGGTVILDAGNPGSSYKWSNTLTTQTITVSSSNNYIVTVTNGSGCKSSSSVLVSISTTPPTVSINASADSFTCAVHSITLTASGTAGNTYKWSTAETTAAITVTSPNSYRVTATGLNTCTAVNTIPIISNTTAPDASVDISGPTTFCEPGSVVLEAVKGLTYHWSNNLTTRSIIVNQSNNYTVTVTGSNACTAVSTPVVVTVIPIFPPHPVSNSPVTVGDTIKLSSNTITNAVYQWTGPDGFSSQEQNPQLPNSNNAMSGIYYVTDTVNGCSSLLDSVVVKVVAPLSGTIRSETGDPVNTVTVTATGSSTQSSLTGSSGTYSLDLLPGGAYTVTPSKNNDSLTYNGVSVADNLLVQRHIKGRNLLTPYKIIAADMNSDQLVSDPDLTSIRDMILLNTPLFPGNKLWAFVPSDSTFADSLNPFPFPSSRNYNDILPQTGQDFIGIKLGDVNNTWNPNIRSTPDSVHFSLPSVIVKKDSSFSIPISVKDFNIVGGFQFTLHWNPAILGLTGIDTTTGTLKVAYSDSSASKGMLSVLWTDPHAESTTLADNSTIFSAQFNAKGNYNAVSPLSIDASLIPVQIIDSTVTDLALSMISGQVTIDSDRTVGIVDIKGGELNGMEISPNPFADYTTLTVDLASARKVQLQVMDATGREVQSIHTNFITGKNQMKIGGKLAAGTYFLKFTTDNFSKTMKMIATGR